MADRPLTLTVDAVDGSARSTTIRTARGAVETPCFMPVGTRGSVKTLTAEDLESLGAGIVLANTYHLMLRPGSDVVESLGGIHGFSGWSGHTLTDSGGYQVFSLPCRVDDDGVTFQSVYDGSRVRLTPERAVAEQEAIGADIAMVLDVCPPADAGTAVLAEAVERTTTWAERALAAHRRPDQSLFGIVQGGTDERIRAEHARRLVDLDFAGYAVGGLSVGEPRERMLPALAAATDHLPADRPRYLMGVGDPASMVEAVARGVDLFDCVLPTRLARHGTALTATGRVNLKNARFARDDDPIDPVRPFPASARYSRGYLRHLFQVKEQTAQRIVTLHNLAFLLDLAARMRSAIEAGGFDALRAEVLTVWGDR